MSNYILKCPACEKEYSSEGQFRMKCDLEIKGVHRPALLKAVYAERHINVKPNLPGVFEYLDWLPTNLYYIDSTNLGKPITYKSEGLAKRLGLQELYIAFSGYWPEKGAKLLTRAFKEFESQANYTRYLVSKLDTPLKPLVVSSAGNTANGYSLVAHILGVSIFLVVPIIGLKNLLLPFKTNPFIVGVEGDYSDAIDLAKGISKKLDLIEDGGVRSVGRRAGLAVPMLHAVANKKYGTKKLFNHYFQAVGSGTGAIAAWEATQLLLKDGRFGDTVTKIHMAQNAPFTPIPDSWESGKNELVEYTKNQADDKISAVSASVLTNRYPPYVIKGGVYDTLKLSGGDTWKVTNARIFESARMFRETENVDIGPSAAVAVDALIQAVESGVIKENESVLLHITGGGKEIQYSDSSNFTPSPKVVVEPCDYEKVINILDDIPIIFNPLEKLRIYKNN